MDSLKRLGEMTLESTSNYGFVDLPYTEVQKYLDELKERKRRRTCKMLPRGRFILKKDLEYNGLVCSPMDMGGKATGLGGGYCNNCAKEKKRDACKEMLNRMRTGN